MTHQVHIKVGKHQKQNGVLNFKKVTIREKLLRLMFGAKQEVMVLLPGETVKEVEISEIKEGEKVHE
jgi:hypothetical protein